jgi:hypothetical protein
MSEQHKQWIGIAVGQDYRINYPLTINIIASRTEVLVRVREASASAEGGLCITSSGF